MAPQAQKRIQAVPDSGNGEVKEKKSRKGMVRKPDYKWTEPRLEALAMVLKSNANGTKTQAGVANALNQRPEFADAPVNAMQVKSVVDRLTKRIVQQIEEGSRAEPLPDWLALDSRLQLDTAIFR